MQMIKKEFSGYSILDKMESIEVRWNKRVLIVSWKGSSRGLIDEIQYDLRSRTDLNRYRLLYYCLTKVFDNNFGDASFLFLSFKRDFPDWRRTLKMRIKRAIRGFYDIH